MKTRMRHQALTICCDFGRGIHLTPIAAALAGGCGFDLGPLVPVSGWHLLAAIIMAMEVVHSFTKATGAGPH